MEDDDWGLTFEELDSLERNAAAQLASRKKPPILSGVNPPHKTGLEGGVSSAKGVLGSPPKDGFGSSISSRVCTSPAKKAGREFKVKVFRDEPGRIGVESTYHPVSRPIRYAASIKPVRSTIGEEPNRCPEPHPGLLQAVRQMSRVHSYLDPLSLVLKSPGKQSVPNPPLQTVSKDLVTVIRTISGKRWDQPRKVWTFPEGVLDDVVRAIRSVSRLQITVSFQSQDMDVPTEIEVEPPLSISASGLLEGPTAESKDFQEDGPDIVSTLPQTISSQGTIHDRGVQNTTTNESPKIPQQEHPSEDGAWKSSRSSNSQSCQVAGSSQLLCKKCTVKLLLHSSGKIAAKFDYDSALVTAFRKIPKADWNAKERLWMFPFSSLLEAEKILSNVIDRSVKVEPLEPLVKRALEATAALPDLRERYSCVPEALKETLMDFQVDGVRFSLQHGGRALIADEMGLGKTLQALAVVSCLKEDWPVLIIVPSSLRLNWATMLEKWLQIDPTDILVVMSQGSSHQGFKIVRTTGKHKLCLDGLFNIVSYDVLGKLEETICTADFKIVIADESHYMKNPSAKRTNACVPVLQKAKYALLLTGTPALSRPIEMFKQLEALQPSAYKRINEYGKRYCMGGIFGVWQGASNHDELHALVKSTVMIRRLKKDVLTQLPKKRREQVFISLDDMGARKLHGLFNELEAAKAEHRVALSKKDPEESSRLNFVERQLLSKIYVESAESKLPAVLDYLTTILEAGCKFLVFGHHQCMLDGIQDLLQKKKVAFIRIDGKTPAPSRQDLVKRFQEKADVMVALLGIRAAGVGLTLTAASTVIFAEMSWTPGDLVQAEDRVHRIGQESAVNVYYLHANGSIDDLIWDAVQHKLENLGQVLDGDVESSMNVASATTEHGGTSNGQDPYLRPCGKSSAPIGTWNARSHAAEIMTSSQAQATLDAFLRPFETGAKAVSPGKQVPVSGIEDEVIPRSSAEGTASLGNHSSKRRRLAGHSRASWSQPNQDITDLQDDI